LTSNVDTKIVSYITEMQSTGFRLSATNMRRYVLHIVKKNEIEKIPSV
jgi:hypothetical protein